MCALFASPRLSECHTHVADASKAENVNLTVTRRLGESAPHDASQRSFNASLRHHQRATQRAEQIRPNARGRHTLQKTKSANAVREEEGMPQPRRRLHSASPAVRPSIPRRRGRSLSGDRHHYYGEVCSSGSLYVPDGRGLRLYQCVCSRNSYVALLWHCSAATVAASGQDDNLSASGYGILPSASSHAYMEPTPCVAPAYVDPRYVAL